MLTLPKSHLDMAMRFDRVAFSEQVDLTPDPWQEQLLRSQSKRILINASRQSGKSQMSAVIGLHTAIYESDSPVLILSPSQRQSAECFKKVLNVYRSLEYLPPDAESDAESALRLELKNRSRIIALPGKEATVRSFSGVKLLIIDEASRVPDELYQSVRPMLAVSGGRIIVLSTPWGTRGFYWEAWKHRENWDYYEVPAEMCPRITPEFLQEEEENIGEYFFEQEYHCKFLDAQTAAFRSEDIARIIDRSIEPWDFETYSA